jgi:hypothetical protein
MENRIFYKLYKMNSEWVANNQDKLQKEIEHIINKINVNTEDDVFDILEKIQDMLAVALWKDNIVLNDYLEKFTRFFDRLDSKDERFYIKNNIETIKIRFL